MNFWCIYFEGLFAKDSRDYPNQPFFSGCLIQADSCIDAEDKFLLALSERKVILIEIGEKIDINTNDLDLEDEDNLFWIKWCEEVEKTGKPMFDTFHLYPLEELEKTLIEG